MQEGIEVRMVHILLVILKFIGIVLASILGLILFLLLIVLFGPIGYRAKGRAQSEEIFLEGKVSWLGFVLRGKVLYQNGKLHWYFRIFGILLASNEEEFLQKKGERSRKKEAGKKKKEQKKRKSKKEEPKRIESKKEEKKAEVKAEDEKRIEEKLAETKQEEPKQIEVKPEKPKQIEEKPLGKDSLVPEKQPEKETISEKQEKKSFARKLLEKGKSFFEKWKRKLSLIPEKIEKLKMSWDKKMDKLKAVKEFWNDEVTKEVKKRLIATGKKLLLHILPRKWKGRIEFGLEDPYVMGQILMVCGILMPIYEDKLEIKPDFEEEKLSGSFSLKGHIIPGYLLFQCLSLLLNKNIRITYKKGKKLLGGN